MLREVDLYEPTDIEMFIEVLKHLQSKGFKYIVRSPGMQSVLCFSCKPKKYYMDDEVFDFFWGYHDKDLPQAKPAHLIWFDAPGIKSNSRSALLIEDWLREHEVI